MKVFAAILAAVFSVAICGCGHTEGDRPTGVSSGEKVEEIETNSHMTAEQKMAAEQQMSAAAAQARAQAASQRTPR